MMSELRKTVETSHSQRPFADLRMDENFSILTDNTRLTMEDGEAFGTVSLEYVPVLPWRFFELLS
jgi:hypothetical protein